MSAPAVVVSSSLTLLFDVCAPCVLPGFAVRPGDVLAIRPECPVMPGGVVRCTDGRWRVAHEYTPDTAVLAAWLTDGTAMPRDGVTSAWARRLAA